MSSSGALPPNAGSAEGVTNPSQLLASQLQESTDLPHVANEERNAQTAGSSGAERIQGTSTGQMLAVPAQSSDQPETSTGLSGDTANDPAESIGRGSKRSLGGRQREGSTGSKRSAQRAAGISEKTPRPASAGRPQVVEPPRPKKKGGLLSFLSCCTSPDDSQDIGQQEAAQPAKPVAKPQAARVQQPVQASQQQNLSATNTSAEDSKERIDEKAGQLGNPSMSTPEPIAPLAQSGTLPETAAYNKPVPTLPQDAPQNQVDSQASNFVSNSQREAVPAEPTLGSPLNTNIPLVIPPIPLASSGPPIEVEAPTPIVPQVDDDEMIHDRTPIQAARDNDIEMTDVGPTIPLTEDEAARELERERKESQGHEPVTTSGTQMQLPGPPPLPISSTGDTVQTVQAVQPATGTGTDGASISSQKWLLPPLRPEFRGRKCLVLDLDETLVHASFKILHQADFTIPVEIEGQYHNVYVIKRPGVDTFLKRVGELYEVVVFTASVSKYGDPVLDQLDIHHVVQHRLFRESCYNHQGNYVKDLSQVGRDLRETIIIDNSPTSYIFHPQHAVPVSSWFSDAHDNELLDLIPVLEDLAGQQVADVTLVLDVAL